MSVSKGTIDHVWVVPVLMRNAPDWTTCSAVLRLTRILMVHIRDYRPRAFHAPMQSSASSVAGGPTSGEVSLGRSNAA